MAKFIPPLIADYKYDGEQHIAQRIQDDAATANWIVLHSLDVAAHRSQMVGECDFVIIVPGKGVLCLEVKGCKSLRVTDGGWYYGVNPKADRRGPFKQAAEAMFSIRNFLFQKHPAWRNTVFFTSAVVFPFINFTMSSPEWHDWQVITAAALESRPMHSLCSSIIAHARRSFSDKAGKGWFDPSGNAPSVDLCHQIADVLRPQFEFYEPPATRRRNLDQRLKHYTREQFGALDAMQANLRVIFNGPAGAGKTLLAVETARRAGLRGQRTLFLCFNKHIAAWLKTCFAASDQAHITISTLHAFMLKVAGIRPLPPVLPEFWTSHLPEVALEAALERDAAPSFDFLVIDEAQDILRPAYLDVLDVCLEGGLKQGSWYLFGDFVYQQIYRTVSVPLDRLVNDGRGDAADGKESPDPRMLSAPVYTLSINCRNTPRIAACAPLLGGLTPDYSQIRRPDDHINPELLFVKDEAAQVRLLADLLERFRSEEKFRGDEMVILSPRAINCCASQLPSPWKDRIRPFSVDNPSGQIRYVTIHAFKGLEAPVIIVTDVEKIHTADDMRLLYVAVTRALSRLVVIFQAGVREEVLQLLGGEAQRAQAQRGNSE